MANKTHTDLSPSNAERWMNCPGSVGLCATLPKPDQSPAAADGQAAHALLEKCLKNPKLNPFDFVGETLRGESVEIDEAMADAVSYALDIVRMELQKGGELLVEQKVSIFPGIGGTLDIAIIREFVEIHVFDFKYGRGILVPATDNPQLLLYLLPLAEKYEAPQYRLTIIQPRTERQVNTWGCDAEYLAVFRQEALRKVELTKEPNATIAPGTWCKWCWAKTICPALRKDLGNALVPVQNTELIFPNVKGLSLDVVKKVLDYRERIEAYLEAVAAYAQEVLEAGGVIAGYELGKKRANRKWINEKEAIKAFQDIGEKAFKTALLSPAQMEKIVGKERVAPLTEVPDNGMTLKKTGETK